MTAKNEYFAIFGGGGIRGISYCGAYKALIENDINLTGYAGSSIGAVFASLIAVGYNYQEAYEILSNTGLEMFIDINIDFKKELAISKGKIFLDWMKDKIESKFYGQEYKEDKMPPVKFSDIEKKLIIYSVDLTNLQFLEFSKEKTPDFEIAKSIRASVSMPGLFTPLELNETLVVDGDLLKSTPLWRVCDSIKNLSERILEFRLEDNETPKKITNSIEYLNRVYNAFCGFSTDYIVDMYNEKDKFDYIKINTPEVSVVDFLIPKEKRKELFDIGYNTTNEYLKVTLCKKKSKLLVKYKFLLEMLKKLQKELNKKTTLSSYLYLSEIFVYLCEEKKYIDISLYNKLLDFKNTYTKNYKQKSFLGIKSTELRGKNELKDSLSKIIKTTKNKILELEN